MRGHAVGGEEELAESKPGIFRGSNCEQKSLCCGGSSAIIVKLVVKLVVAVGPRAGCYLLSGPAYSDMYSKCIRRHSPSCILQFDL